jgi:hypothetical protein
MTFEETIRLFVGFLGGGLIGAILNWLHNALNLRITRQSDYLSRQLNDLYGPLYFFASQNEKLHDLTVTMNAAYTKEYCDKEWSTDKSTTDSLSKETTATIDISNEYTQVMCRNNEKMAEILTKNYALIDQDDSALFQEIVLLSLRNRIEFGSGTLAVPPRIYEHMGNISFYRSDWATRIRDRFREKSTALADLRLAWWWTPFFRKAA